MQATTACLIDARALRRLRPTITTDAIESALTPCGVRQGHERIGCSLARLCRLWKDAAASKRARSMAEIKRLVKSAPDW